MRIRKTSAERKGEIVDATLRLADRLGPDRLSTDAIAQEVGLTQAAIFRHFPTKQDIWMTVAGAIADRMTAGWSAAVDDLDDPADRVQGLVLAQLRLIEITPAIPAILFSRELHSENRLLREAVMSLMERFHKAIAREVEGAIDARTFRSDLDPDDAAFLLIGLVQGMAVRWSLSGRTFDLQRVGKRILAAQIRLFGVLQAAPIGKERA